MPLAASSQSQKNGFLRQEAVRRFLDSRHHVGWVNSRDLLELEGTDININLAEKIRGDLVNLRLDLSVEVQTSEWPSPNVSWKKSKHELSQATWQCFVYELPDFPDQLWPLMIETARLRELLGPIEKISWQKYERDSSTLLFYDWLRNNGALTLIEWVAEHKVVI